MTEQFPYAAVACGVLHNVLYRKPTSAFLDELKSAELPQQWPQFGSDVSAALAMIQTSLEQDDFDAIERDYYQLFVGPGPMQAYPWGSVYTDKENLVCGATTVAFKQFCRDHGIAFELAHNEPEDHIGLVLAVLGQLFEQGNQDAIKALLAHHLLPWSHRVTDAMAEHAQTGLYRGFGQLTAALLKDWQTSLQVTPDSIRLYK
ncbi:molecular chaperone TorD family protein [Ferrimonas balearica]|uniref:TorD/DmsD family molecular chaperone n=1 Tax=Ferrimonas balearica TaxID=44012 RepID=UPI001C56EE5B|nr:molecular chaperone TorD family protein [Ferrimonas balearica]MBW3141482.1 molecular chaperone TorD family protein [Ferrimonas balearica]MBY6108526.1 molecular chaperone TorD family protein [Ferrimonas balearica]